MALPTAPTIEQEFEHGHGCLPAALEKEFQAWFGRMVKNPEIAPLLVKAPIAVLKDVREMEPFLRSALFEMLTWYHKNRLASPAELGI